VVRVWVDGAGAYDQRKHEPEKELSMAETTSANGPGLEQQAAAKWLHKRTRPLFATLAVALHNGEVMRIDEAR
jgi:hypothetical protein